jgi:hypothetical protein
MSSGDFMPKAPGCRFISMFWTFYADHACGMPRRSRDPAHEEEKGGRNLRTIRTNRYGLAKVDRLAVSSELRDEHDLSLNFLATDRQGKSGKHAEGYYLSDRAALRVETDKTLYAPGEAITVMLTSSENNATALLQVAHESGVVYSNLVHLSGGRASVTPTWTAAFRDGLTISALSHLSKWKKTVSPVTPSSSREIADESRRQCQPANLPARHRGAGQLPCSRSRVEQPSVHWGCDF